MGAGRAVLTRSAIALCVFAGACSTSGTPIPEVIDVASLDIGNYSTEPLDTEAGRADADGPILEGIRMAEAIAFPDAIDPALTIDWGAGVIENPDKAVDLSAISNVNLPVLQRHGMITGFDVARGDREFRSDNATVTRVFLIRFPDDAAAAAAAADMDMTDFAVSPDNVAVVLPEHPVAHAHWRPAVATMAATLAAGEFVVSVFVQQESPDGAVLAARIDDALAAQLELLDDFEPTPVAAVDELPRDPDGMLRRTLTAGPRDQTPRISASEFSSWSGRAVEFQRPTDERLTQAWTADAVGKSGTTTTFRFPDADAALAFGDAWTDTLGEGVEVFDGPVGARCGHRPADDDRPAAALCYVSYDRYGALVRGGTSDDAEQQAAAQYGLFVTTE